MQMIVIIGALTALVASTIAAPTCDDSTVNATMIKCLTENGFTLADAMRYVPSESGMVNLNEDDLKRQCAHKTQYAHASLCITAELSVCAPGVDLLSLVPSIDKTTKIMNLMCDDPELKFDCLALISKHTATIQTCVTSRFDFAAHRDTPMKQLVCESSKVGLDCAVDLIRKCDDHTASVVEEAGKLYSLGDCDAN